MNRHAALARVLAACVLAAAFCAGVASAQPACRVLDPELVGTYSGGCSNGLADGTGEARGLAEYTGDFRAGRKHGRGIKAWPSGDRFEGEVIDDRREGSGTYVWSPRGPSAGERYTGGYRADRRHGFGTYTWPGGDAYAGPWADDEPVGSPTARMLARARMAKEAEVALTRPGIRVCRQLTAGISEREWVRGVVTGETAGQLEIRIEDAGRLSHTLNGVDLRIGVVIRDSTSGWTPCR